MNKLIQIVLSGLLLLLLSSASSAEESIIYYHNDLLGSPVAATDEQGNLLWRESYKPYGEKLLNEQTASSDKLWYTGKAHDDDIGLSYFGARYYDPVVGRFMAIDPVGVLGNIESNPMMFNRYAYGNNNPYRFVDPDGREAIGVSVGFSFTIPKTAINLGFSTTLAIDTSLDGMLLFTPEGGVGTPGGSGFVRAVIAPNPSHTVDDLHGGGLSVSGAVDSVSGSATKPSSEGFDAFPIVEVGRNFGSGGVSATYGEGMTPSELRDTIKKHTETIKAVAEITKGVVKSLMPNSRQEKDAP